jgi:DNA-binding protein H-NS
LVKTKPTSVTFTHGPEEYQITSLSLTAAIANGISVEQIIKILVKLSKNAIDATWTGRGRA